MEAPESVKKAEDLTVRDMGWQPYYRNNMLGGGMAGYYCVVSMPDGSFPRKYTILFQYKEVTGYEGKGLEAKWSPVDRYVLFEKSYPDYNVPCYPSPKPNVTADDLPAMGDINELGTFIYAYKTMKLAKRRALHQFKSVFEYAVSRAKKAPA